MKRDLGFGLMRLTGDAAWGPPPVWSDAVDLIQLAYELGVRIFDTAWYYGPDVTNRLLADALFPYPDDIVIITKAGNSRGPNRSWRPALQPIQLRHACLSDLKSLKVSRLPLVLLRWLPQAEDEARFSEALAELIDLKSSGFIGEIGLSNVEMRHILQAQRTCEIAAVSNSFSVYSRRDAEVLEYCTMLRIKFLPYYPLLGGDVVRQPLIERIAREMAATPAQVALAWLLAQSPVIVPIPGTSRVDHLRQNLAAASLTIPSPRLSELNELRETRSL